MGFVSFSFAAANLLSASAICARVLRKSGGGGIPPNLPPRNDAAGPVKVDRNALGAGRLYLFLNSVSLSFDSVLQLLMSLTVRWYGISTIVLSPCLMS